MSKTIIFGDVHGCATELAELLDTVAPTVGDVVVSVGDLLDKGPDCAGVVRLCRTLNERTGATFVLVRGNHEERHERFRKAEASGKPNPMARLDELRAAAKGLTEEDVAFLDAAVPSYHNERLNVTVVHAGVLPTHQELPTDWSALNSKAKKFQSLVYRVRYTTAEGGMVVLGEEKPEHKFWAEVYDGRFGHIYFGHQPYTNANNVVRFTHATGLDLGCVYGNKLAATILEEGKEPVFVYVNAKHTYASHRHGGDE